MSAAGQRTRLFIPLAIVSYVAVFSAFVVVERPGLGIGHFFYVPIALLALASGPRRGMFGGLVATALYAGGVYFNPDLPPVDKWESSLIRLVTFVGIGLLIGWFASSKRTLVAERSRLAERDALTGLPNTRSFEAAIERRFADGRPFALLLGDVDSLGEINSRDGRSGGDDALRRLADVLTQAKRPEDEVARVGGDEFAILAPCEKAGARELALRLERLLALSGASITFGWATSPREGRNALALYRAADERLYARKLARGYRRGSAALEVVGVVDQ
jgi:diguanylate cyclase (GGDEF)-like protein